MQPQKSSSKKIIIILVVVLVLGAGVYFYMSGSPHDDSSLVTTDTTAGDPEIGAHVLTLLHQISSLKIDTSLFTSQAYSSLVDHTVPIYDQGVGKQNPFLNPHPSAPAAH